jgi:hypothetical protein
VSPRASPKVSPRASPKIQKVVKEKKTTRVNKKSMKGGGSKDFFE